MYRDSLWKIRRDCWETRALIIELNFLCFSSTSTTLTGLPQWEHTLACLLFGFRYHVLNWRGFSFIMLFWDSRRFPFHQPSSKWCHYLPLPATLKLVRDPLLPQYLYCSFQTPRQEKEKNNRQWINTATTNYNYATIEIKIGGGEISRKDRHSSSKAAPAVWGQLANRSYSTTNLFVLVKPRSWFCRKQPYNTNTQAGV